MDPAHLKENLILRELLRIDVPLNLPADLT